MIFVLLFRLRLTSKLWRDLHTPLCLTILL
jgi:hypothetical protein